MLLRAKGGKGLGVGCGEGGGEYDCSTGSDRRDGSRPAGCEIVVREVRHGSYAVTRAAPGTAPAPLEVRVFWKSRSWAMAISIACAMTYVRSVLPPRYFAYWSTARTRWTGRRRVTVSSSTVGFG